MERFDTHTFSIYRDIGTRTNGAIYLGVVGPVRTGKSTFIKRFMDVLVLPNLSDVHIKEQITDELPQSGNGKTIMTTEPKFIPMEPAKITLEDGSGFRVRLIDCVGYMTEGALGHMEESAQRMVKTPWSEEEIPFVEAAEIGTGKVIRDHSTIGIVVTTDGSFGELPRENYVAPEEQTISELKEIGKPFIVLLNSSRPYSREAKELSSALEEKYGARVYPVNCLQLRQEDITHMMEMILASFPVKRIQFSLPRWTELLEETNPLRQSVIRAVRNTVRNIRCMQDVTGNQLETDCEYIQKISLEEQQRETGIVTCRIQIKDHFYYEMLSEILGTKVTEEADFLKVLHRLARSRQECEALAKAWEELRQNGYGVVEPSTEEITISEPELVRHGNKYGVRIVANAPSAQLIRANIETEISPIVGTQEQANDLIAYMKEQSSGVDGTIFETNIFGKTLKQLIDDGIHSKINNITEENKEKLQNTMQKIINESKGGFICIII